MTDITTLTNAMMNYATNAYWHATVITNTPPLEPTRWWTEPLPAWVVLMSIATALFVKRFVQYMIGVIKANSWRFRSKP